MNQIETVVQSQSETGEVQKIPTNQTELTEQIIFALSSAVEAKDRYTNGHSYRVAKYAQEIARRMGWNEEQQRNVYYTGLLHDVGKIHITDRIINKTARLDYAEYEEMKLHTLAGYYILKEISAIAVFAIGARWHHERYDGRGYPNGLSGENIPLISRIIGVADAYDAMTSNRSYRKVLPQDVVRSEIDKGAGTQFDPAIAKILLQMIDDDKDYKMHQPDATCEHIILAVDDDPMVLKLLQFTLSKESHYRLITASCGKDAMEILKKQTVDLVLLDVEMPQMDGFEVLERIRKTYDNLPVIFMTGEKDMEIIQKAEAMGISDYLTKPMVAHMLYESIHNVLLSKHYQPF